jgi:hypothetical protein
MSFQNKACVLYLVFYELQVKFLLEAFVETLHCNVLPRKGKTKVEAFFSKVIYGNLIKLQII